jgi:hypothetical protein
MGNKKLEAKRLAKKRRVQRTWLFLLLGGIILIGVAFFLVGKPQPKAAIEVTGAPSLKVDKEQVDLGDEKLGSTVKVSFLLTNVGDQPLRFSKDPYVEVVEGC